MKMQIRRFLKVQVVLASFLWTAAAGIAPAHAETIQETAFGPGALIPREPAQQVWHWEGWKGFFPLQSATKIFSQFKKEIPKPKPAPKKFLDPFKAARILMTSA